MPNRFIGRFLHSNFRMLLSAVVQYSPHIGFINNNELFSLFDGYFGHQAGSGGNGEIARDIFSAAKKSLSHCVFVRAAILDMPGN
jgi:hypothetical protein